MSEINFGATQGQQLATLMRVVSDMHRDLYGNGQKGLKAKAEDFMNQATGAVLEQEKQHEQNSLKLNWILAICAVGTLFLMTLGTIVTIEVTFRKASSDPAHIFHSQQLPAVYAFRQQPPEDAGSTIPPHY